MITVTAFAWVPPFAEGLVRDLRVRWALEEAGEQYDERLLNQGEQNSPDYCAIQPFGQVPVYEEDGLTLFESGAILLHIQLRGQHDRRQLRQRRRHVWVRGQRNGRPLRNLHKRDRLVGRSECWLRYRCNTYDTQNGGWGQPVELCPLHGQCPDQFVGRGCDWHDSIQRDRLRRGSGQHHLRKRPCWSDKPTRRQLCRHRYCHGNLLRHLR